MKKQKESVTPSFEPSNPSNKEISIFKIHNLKKFFVIFTLLIISIFLIGRAFKTSSKDKTPSDPLTQSLLTSPHLPSKKDPKQTSERIISSEVSTDSCKIKVKTTEREFYQSTDFPQLNTQIKCYQFLLNKVSPSGKYLVFEDILGGLDSALKVYSIEHNETFQLASFGTSEIFDISFFSDDKLLALYGYKGLYKEQYLKMFDLPQVFKDYPENVNKQYNFFMNLSPHSKNIVLPDVSQDYARILVLNKQIRLYGAGGTNTKVLAVYGFDDF